MHKINWIRLNSPIVPHLHTLENLKINENKWKWPEMRVLRSWKLWMVAFENKRKESIKRMYQQITFYAMLFEMQQPANVRPKLCNYTPEKWCCFMLYAMYVSIYSLAKILDHYIRLVTKSCQISYRK